MTATQPPPAPPQRQPVWPYVIGVLSMALAAQKLLSLLGIGIQVAVQLLLAGPGGSLTSIFGGFGAWQLSLMIQRIFHPLLGTILMAAGFALYKHSRFAPVLHVIYAIPAVLLAVVFPILYVTTCPPQLMPQMAFWPIWQSTTSLIYPVFLLVWFSRAKVKQQVRTYLK